MSTAETPPTPATPTPRAADRELCGRIIAGNAAALEELLNGHGAESLRHIAKLYFAPTDYGIDQLRSDLRAHIQQADCHALRLWRGECSLKSWRNTLAVQVCRDRLKSRLREARQQRQFHEETKDDVAADPFEAVYGAQLKLDLVAAIESLPTPQERLFSLHHFVRGHSIGETAVILQITRSNADTLKHRATAHLRAALLRCGVVP
jgi:RNA polymerase sigma factor (sigma-70 family)